MEIDDLNLFIKHYLENDKTNSAIMLKGKWGVGKSYYINNCLVPFLGKDGKRTCIIVSLYGIENLSDISESIFMEVYGNKLPKIFRNIIRDILQHIIKYLLGLINISGLFFSKRTLKNLYEQCNLEGKLLVFEDLERSQIDIDKILGYVSNLVDKGAKVLFVANEDEILKSEPAENNGSEESKYRRAKEKVISDTIEFSLPIECAIKDIVKKFQNPTLSNLFNNDDKVKNVSCILREKGNSNLRTFICCCQKSVDIIEMIKNILDDNGVRYKEQEDFYSCVFNGILYFLSENKKNSSFPEWDGTEYLSAKLGSNNFPLIKIAYDYIRCQIIDYGQVLSTYKEYEKLEFYRKNNDGSYDEDIGVIYYYCRHTEHEVRMALQNLEKKLENNKKINFYAYPKLAYFIPKVSNIVDYNYKKIKDLMIRNVKGVWKEYDDINTDILFWTTSENCDYKDDKLKMEVNEFIKELSDSINSGKYTIEFSYNPVDIEKLYNDICSPNVGRYISGNRFISKFDVDKIVEMLVESTPKQIDDFRGILFAVYRDSNLSFTKEDIFTLSSILNKIEKIPKNWDRIQLIQINWLCENIKSFLNK